MWSVLALLMFAAGISCDTSPTITQRPQWVVERPSGDISLACSLEGYGNPNFYWYRQTLGRPMEMLFYSVSKESVERTGPMHFKASRPTDNLFNLRIPGLLANDTGVYFCAWSRTLCQRGLLCSDGQLLSRPSSGGTDTS